MLIDGGGTAQPTLDLSGGAASVLHLVVGAFSSNATLTVSNGNVTDRKLVVSGNVGIGGLGTLTHTANPAGETLVYRLALNVSKTLRIADGGSINVSSKG